MPMFNFLKKRKERKAAEALDEARLVGSGAKESGYHAPTKADIGDIKHDHNTAAAGAITADELIRRERDTATARAPEEAKEEIAEQLPEQGDSIEYANQKTGAA
jgi:hypothetical protein